jgi:large subunit ribosomal protein L9
MARNVKLLLTENVEALGIVGDVVNVRTGYARNFLLPRSLATEPSEERIKALSVKRAEAEKLLAELRKQREALAKKLEGVEVHLTRSCNDQGILYGAITQHDVSDALAAMGHAVKARDVRLTQVIKRIDTYDVHIKLDSDLDSTIKLWVVADRKLDLGRDGGRDEPSEGAGEQAAAESAPAAEKPEGKAGKGEPKGEAKSEAKADEAKPAKAEVKKKDKPEKKDKKADGKGDDAKSGDKSGSKWAPRVDTTATDFGFRPPREKREKGDRKR